MPKVSARIYNKLLMHCATGFMISGDGTTIKNENIEAQHYNMLVEDFSSDSEPDAPAQNPR